MAAVTLELIKKLVDLHHEFSIKPIERDLKLAKDIAEGVKSHGGNWEYEAEKPVISCFKGLTILCWHFSHVKPVEAAAAYVYLVHMNHKVWEHMAGGAVKDTYRSDCHTITNTLGDWEAITKDAHPRREICQQAINVTSDMYGAGAKETVQAEELWKRR